MDAIAGTLIDEPIASDATELAEAMTSAGLPTEGLALPGRVFFRFRAGGEIVASADMSLRARCPHSIDRRAAAVPGPGFRA